MTEARTPEASARADRALREIRRLAELDRQAGVGTARPGRDYSGYPHIDADMDTQRWLDEIGPVPEASLRELEARKGNAARKVAMMRAKGQIP